MERRKFLVGVGGTAIGGSALVGSGAFSRVESDRTVKIAVAEDPDAYLGLDECDTLHGDNYVEFEDGHLKVDIGDFAPDDDDRGIGVNSNSRTWLDSVFQICNQGKEAAGIWLDADPNTAEGGEDAVKFYRGDDRDRRVDNEDDPIVLDVGECICVGIQTTTHGLSEGDDLLNDDEITIYADVDVSGEPAKQAEEFTTVGRIRRGALGDGQTWELSISEDFHAPGGAQAHVTEWKEDEKYSFEFSFNGEEYDLTVKDEDDGEVGSLTTDEVAAPAAESQLRINLRASDSGITLHEANVNGSQLGGASADNGNSPVATIPVVTFDTNDFTVSGTFEFDELGPGDEKPALDIQIEDFADE